MGSTPNDLRVAESHEWHRLQGDTLTLGITKHAADELTDVTYVEIRDPGSTFDAGDSVGELESVKATSDVYSAVGGEIVEVNEALADDPGLVNRDPYGEGWLCRIKVADASPLDDLMDASAYDEKYPT